MTVRLSQPVVAAGPADQGWRAGAAAGGDTGRVEVSLAGTGTDETMQVGGLVPSWIWWFGPAWGRCPALLLGTWQAR